MKTINIIIVTIVTLVATAAETTLAMRFKLIRNNRNMCIGINNDTPLPPF